MALGKAKEALKLYSKAMSAVQDETAQVQININMGQVWYELDSLSKAKECFQLAIRGASETPVLSSLKRTAQYNLGCIYELEGELGLAYK